MGSRPVCPGFDTIAITKIEFDARRVPLQLQRTPWSRDSVENEIVARLFKFSDIYKTRKFITVFTEASCGTPPRARWHQATPSAFLPSALKSCKWRVSCYILTAFFLSVFICFKALRFLPSRQTCLQF